MGKYFLSFHFLSLTTTRVLSTRQGQPRWVVRFRDGYVIRCTEKALRKMLVACKQGDQVAILIRC